jgi:hypothetical protein
MLKKLQPRAINWFLTILHALTQTRDRDLSAVAFGSISGMIIGVVEINCDSGDDLRRWKSLMVGGLASFTRNCTRRAIN